MLTDFQSLIKKIERGELHFLAELGYKTEQNWFYDEIQTSSMANYGRLKRAIERNPILEVPSEKIPSKLSTVGHVFVDYREYAIGYVAGEFVLHCIVLGNCQKRSF